MLVGRLAVLALGLLFLLAWEKLRERLNWLLSTLLPYIVFALIVVFQSEIRPCRLPTGDTHFIRALVEFRGVTVL